MDQNELRQRKQKGPYFELTLTTHLNIYDKLPYTRDINLCPKDSIRHVSGNVLKYYHYESDGMKNISHN